MQIINNNENIILNFADLFIYKLVKTYSYKFSYFLSTCYDSIIHPEHLEFHKMSRDNMIKKIKQENL